MTEQTVEIMFGLLDLWGLLIHNNVNVPGKSCTAMIFISIRKNVSCSDGSEKMQGE